jgi:predicted phage terminase large subunit-like protein
MPEMAKLTDNQHSPGWKSMKYKAVKQFANDVSIWQKWTNIYRGQDQFDSRSGPEAAEEFFKKHQDKMLEGTKVIWPQQENYYQLMVLREDLGYRSFQSEKQNEPIDPERCIFKKENFHFWDDKYKNVQHLLEAIGKRGRFYAACDPSLGKSKKHDYTAIIVLLKDTRTSVNYVIAADISHTGPDGAIKKLSAYTSMYPVCRVGIETNSFQVLLVNQLKEELKRCNQTIRIEEISNTGNKNARISGLEPYINQGTLKFNRNQLILLDQLYQFPLAQHDDGPDALQMALYTARKRTYVGAWPRPEEYRDF